MHSEQQTGGENFQFSENSPLTEVFQNLKVRL